MRGPTALAVESEASGTGLGWVRLERSTRLFRHPANAGRRLIPLRLAGRDCPSGASASSPRLAPRAYLGSTMRWRNNPNGIVAEARGSLPQPRRGCGAIARRFPRVVPPTEQPWAWFHSPAGADTIRTRVATGLRNSNTTFPESHNSADKPRVRRLAERLRAAGLHQDFFGFRISDFGFSPKAAWVGLERSTVLFRDPANAGRRCIPLLLGAAPTAAAHTNARSTFTSVKHRHDTQKSPGSPPEKGLPRNRATATSR
jgi:hypothetical protein